MLPEASDWRPGPVSPARTKSASSAPAGRGRTQATHEQGPSSLSLSAKTTKLVATTEMAFIARKILQQNCAISKKSAAAVDHIREQQLQVLPDRTLQNDKNQGIPNVALRSNFTGPPSLPHSPVIQSS